MTEQPRGKNAGVVDDDEVAGLQKHRQRRHGRVRVRAGVA
jgi:hypothetical protein